MPVFTCRPRNHALQHRLQLSVHCESHSAFTGLERWILLFFFFLLSGFTETSLTYGIVFALSIPPQPFFIFLPFFFHCVDFLIFLLRVLWFLSATLACLYRVGPLQGSREMPPGPPLDLLPGGTVHLGTFAGKLTPNTAGRQPSALWVQLQLQGTYSGV